MEFNLFSSFSLSLSLANYHHPSLGLLQWLLIQCSSLPPIAPAVSSQYISQSDILVSQMMSFPFSKSRVQLTIKAKIHTVTPTALHVCFLLPLAPFLPPSPLFAWHFWPPCSFFRYISKPLHLLFPLSELLPIANPVTSFRMSSWGNKRKYRQS